MKAVVAGAPPVAPDRVLFVGPDMQEPGGVATFCRAVFPQLSFPAEYFMRGGASPSAGVPARLIEPARNYAAFTRRIRDPCFRVVQLNLSLSRVSVLRDRGFVVPTKGADRALVLCIHGWNQRFFDAAHGRRFGSARALLSAADKIYVVNRDAQSSLAAAGYEEIVEVVPSVLEPGLVEGARIDALEASRGRVPVLLFLARLEAAKGVFETVKAFELVKRKCPDAEILVAGDGSAAAAIAEYVRTREISGVRLLGYVTGEAKVAALRRATVYLLPSTHDEGMPHSLIEAMAFGLPVITRPVAGVRDFFVDGAMGFTSETGDPEGLAELVLGLVDDPLLSQRIGRHNFAFARAQFSAAAVAARFDETYRQLAR